MNSSISSSRRGLILFALAGAIVLSGLGAASEWLVHARVLPEDDFLAHRSFFNFVEAGNVAFGDSHVARGFAPNGDFVNLAYPSEGIPHISWKVREYFARRIPTKVILQADAHLFSPYRLAVELGDYPATFSGDVKGLLIAQPRYRGRLLGYWRAYLLSGGSLKSRIVRTASGALLSPGDLAQMSSRRRLYDARARVRVHNVSSGSELDRAKNNYAYLLDFLIQRGAALCLVSFPLSPDYLAALDETPLSTQMRRNELLEYFRDQARRVGARVRDRFRR